ncbi:MAG: dTMP kinase [Parvularculaceae bacterium]|nr:dTMP kinase [Parvularculaceae bacterium]
MTFITFEGPEGAGKSTQIRVLAEALEQRGHEVVLTREPGGAPEAEALRALLLDKDRDWSPLAEALLMNAARDAHVRQTIEPALRRRAVVLCDRFFDSTRAYQHNVGEQTLGPLHKAVVPKLPDLTLLFDLPVEVGLARAASRGAADRFEAKGVAYHEGVRAAFLDIADAEPERLAVVDAAQPIEDVTKAVMKLVHDRLPTLLDDADGRDSAS